jgi:hypothetical protein
VREHQHSCCTLFNKVTVEGIMNVLEEDVHKLWNFTDVQLRMEKPSLPGHLVTLHLYSLHHLLQV